MFNLTGGICFTDTIINVDDIDTATECTTIRVLQYMPLKKVKSSNINMRMKDNTELYRRKLEKTGNKYNQWI